MIFRALHDAGVLGINRRNSEYTLRWNKRRFYPRVDDKLVTKRLCQQAGIPVPTLLATARHEYEARSLLEKLEPYEDFVLKPSRGAMGNGIVVITGRMPGGFRRSGDRFMSHDDFLYHVSGIIAGLYSLAGHLDAAMIEERLVVHPEIAELCWDGIPDVRVIVYRGVPVMAMTRLPTRRSGGRANLHQGAIGAGVDLATGRTHHAVLSNRPVREHPDTGNAIVGRQITAFDRILDIAVRATDPTELGYVGADVVVDARHGPMVLEMNARPGLAIQIANRTGLRPRLDAIDRAWQPGLPVEERVALGRRIAAGVKPTPPPQPERLAAAEAGGEPR